MHELSKAIARIRENDPQYTTEAYFFVFEALHYAHNELNMVHDVQPDAMQLENCADEKCVDENCADEDEQTYNPNHLTGQQLCEAIRLYALEQFGYMASCVLKNWGVSSTNDFGKIVFNLIEVGQMRKTPQDKQEDFDHVFDFEKDLQKNFKISMPE